MYPQPFRYHRPNSVKDAITLLTELGEGAKPLAGGQSLIPILKMRMDEPSDLVDITRIPGLNSISTDNDLIRIGALCTHAQVAMSEAALTIPVLRDCAGGIADPQVRSLGTIGGSVSVADPSSDWPALLFVLDAKIVCQGPEGSRTVGIRDFIVDSYTTCLGDAELVTEIQIPQPPANSGGAYIGFKKAAPAYPAASVAIQLTLDDAGKCKEISLALGSAGPKPIISADAEAILKGNKLTEELLKQAAEKLVAESSPPSDARGSAEFKQEILRSLFLKTAATAINRAGGSNIDGTHDYV
ncbi:MAG: xanthine dehydrogenase family protein subunit M [Gammaproteobacteria bacterium]|nr:xanthine dehydrogenase family protein subunit M [Gammaproteobacteria bacterium]